MRQPRAPSFRKAQARGTLAESSIRGSQSSPPAPPKPEETKALQRVFDNQLLVMVEALVTADPRLQPITDTQERQRVLLRFVAAARMSFHFERVYRLIYGSQIAALRYLSGQNTTIPRTDLKPFFDSAVTTFPLVYTNYTFDQWTGFLELTGAMEKAAGDYVRLSLIGREFLKYLIDMGYPQDNIG